MANTVEIVIKAVNQTGTTLSGITNAFTGMNQGLELARKGFQALNDVYKATITKSSDYISTVTDMSRVIGLGAEETSKLIQASDDLFISQERLQVSLLAATRQGVDVSIEGLKSLSDEYLTLAPGLEQTQFLLQTFGRSGADMGKLMEVGSMGIESYINSIDGALVITEQSERTNIKYKQSLDALNDSYDALGVAIGTKAMPKITAFNQLIIDFVNGNKKASRAAADFLNEIWKGTDMESDYSKMIDAWSDRLQGLADEYYRLHPEIVRVSEDFTNLAASMMSVAGMQSSYEASIGDLNDQLEQTKIDMLAAGSTKFLSEKDAKKVEGYRKALTSVWLQIKEITDSQEINLSDAMGMTGGELVDTGFTDQQIQDIADLRKELGYFEGELTSLGTVAYVKQSQKDDLDELEQKFADIEAQISEVKAAHELATKQIVYDNLLAGMSAEGLTSGEFALAQEYAVGLGLITQNDADLAIALQGISEAIPTQTGLLDEFNTAVSLGDEYIIALNEHVLGMTSEKYIDIYIRTHGALPSGTEPGSEGWINSQGWYGNLNPNLLPERAGGGPVWGGTPYVVGEKGPELFMPNQSGKIIPNDKLGGSNVTFYGDAYFAVDREITAQDIMKQMRVEA